LATLETITREHVTSRYEFQKTLGEGAFGKVKVAALKQNKNKLFAIKSIPREMIDVPESIKNND
jgi:serine/threonine protein kinase